MVVEYARFLDAKFQRLVFAGFLQHLDAHKRPKLLAEAQRDPTLRPNALFITQHLVDRVMAGSETGSREKQAALDCFDLSSHEWGLLTPVQKRKHIYAALKSVNQLFADLVLQAFVAYEQLYPPPAKGQRLEHVAARSQGSSFNHQHSVSATCHPRPKDDSVWKDLYAHLLAKQSPIYDPVAINLLLQTADSPIPEQASEHKEKVTEYKGEGSEDMDLEQLGLETEGSESTSGNLSGNIFHELTEFEGWKAYCSFRGYYSRWNLMGAQAKLQALSSTAEHSRVSLALADAVTCLKLAGKLRGLKGGVLSGLSQVYSKLVPMVLMDAYSMALKSCLFSNCEDLVTLLADEDYAIYTFLEPYHLQRFLELVRDCQLQQRDRAVVVC